MRLRVWTTAATIMNGTLGPAMLVLPLAFHRTGLIPGAICLTVVWLMSFLALLLLLDTCSTTRCTSLVDLCRAHGPYMSMLADTSVVCYYYGTCVSYLILIGGTFQMLLRSLLSSPSASANIAVLLGGLRGSSNSWLLANGGCALLCFFTIVLMLPLSCRDGLSSASFSVFLVVAMYVVLALAVWNCEAVDDSPDLVPKTRDVRELLSGVGTMAYCFASQAVYPPALEALQAEGGGGSSHNDNLSRRLVHSTFGLTLVAYLSVGVGGAVHGPMVPPANILDGCKPHFYIYGAYGALICCLSLAFPVMLIVARMHFLSLAELPLQAVGKGCRSQMRSLVTLSLIVVALIIAILIPKVDVLLSLMGGTCGVALSWVIPALLYKRHVTDEQGIPGNGLTYLLLAFGLLVCVATTPLQIYDVMVARPPPQHKGLHAASTRSGRLSTRSHRPAVLDGLPVGAATRRSYSAMLGPSRVEVRWLLHVADGTRESRWAGNRSKRARFREERERRQAVGGADSARTSGSLALRTLRAWRDFLPRAVVVGLDVDEAAVSAARNESRIAAHTVDSTDGKAVASLNLSSDLDVIIDSARRTWNAQQRALLLLWPHLRATGLYCIEHLSPDAAGLLREAEHRQHRRQPKVAAAGAGSEPIGLPAVRALVEGAALLVLPPFNSKGGAAVTEGNGKPAALPASRASAAAAEGFAVCLQRSPLHVRGGSASPLLKLAPRS